MNFVNSPNLPQAKVTHVIASPKYPQVTAALEKLGITVLSTTNCDTVLEPVSLHADMLVHHLGGNRIKLEKTQQQLKSELTALGFEFPVGYAQLCDDYPHDVALNCCRVSSRIICNSRFADPDIISGLKVVDAAQGYAKCSVCVVDENSVITDDESIARAASAAGLDVLRVRKGFVTLDGFDCGFFGGCCGKLSADTLAFCGDISTHPDFIRVEAFAAERSVNLLSLFGGELLDIGSIIPICQ